MKVVLGLLFPVLVFAYCFDDAASYYRVPSDLLKAIAKVESNFNPGAINKNRNGSVDIGMMQINSVWFPYLRRHGIDVRWLWDPCFNTYVGAMVLRHCINRYGFTWRAVDCYNKGSKAKHSSAYVWKVYKALLAVQRY